MAHQPSFSVPSPLQQLQSLPAVPIGGPFAAISAWPSKRAREEEEEFPLSDEDSEGTEAEDERAELIQATIPEKRKRITWPHEVSVALLEMVAAKPTWRKDQVWDWIHRHHHLMVEADNDAFDSHYANLQRQTSFVLRRFDVKEFTPPKKKMTEAERTSARILFENKQHTLQKLIERGRAAIEQIRARETMATSARSVPADEERAAAARAAEAQKRARQARNDKRQQMADEEQSYRSRTVKLVDLLVTSFNESLEQERAMNQQFAVFLAQCTLLLERVTPGE